MKYYDNYYVDLSRKLNALFGPVIQSVNRIRDALAITIPDSYKAIQKLRDFQYTTWVPLTSTEVELVLKARDDEDMENIIEGRNDNIQLIINELQDNHVIMKRQLIFNEVLSALLNENYYLATLGLIAVIDFIMTELSGKTTHRAIERCEIIKDRLVEREYLDYEEKSILTLLLTYDSFKSSFFANKPFDKIEPKELNRHWIVHGRRTQRLKKTDCRKLLRFLYCMLAMGSLDEFGAIRLRSIDNTTENN